MIEADAVHRIEAAQIIFVRSVVAMPGDDVERGMSLVSTVELPTELGDDFGTTDAVLDPGGRRQKVTTVGETVGPDRTFVRQIETLAVSFADVAVSRFFDEGDAEMNAA